MASEKFCRSPYCIALKMYRETALKKRDASWTRTCICKSCYIETKRHYKDENYTSLHRKEWNGRPIARRPPDLVVESDASLLGWGAATDGVATGGLWSPAERLLHINILEMMAGSFAVQTFARDKQSSVFLLAMNLFNGFRLTTGLRWPPFFGTVNMRLRNCPVVGGTSLMAPFLESSRTSASTAGSWARGGPGVKA